jgi:hypothetical protein
MTELLQLRESSASAFERALLQSADRDAPNEHAFAKTAVALGVGGALVGTAGNAVANAGTATWVTLMLKPMLMGAMGGLVVAVSAHRLSAPSEAPRPAPVSYVPSAPRGELPLRETATPPSQAAFEDESPSGAASEHPKGWDFAISKSTLTPPAPRATSSAPSRAESPIPREAGKTLNPPAEIPSVPPSLATPPAPEHVAPNASGSIASEVSTIDRARHALRDGRPSDALHELDVYRAAWPSGVLATEAAVLRIEAHLALGDRESGIRAARQFLSVNPKGRYAARVRELFNPSELE